VSVNKNFVVKNGFEVSTDLILANATTKKVGIGSTNPRYKLDVAGGIGATDSYISGISTVINQFNVGTGGTIFTVLGVGGSIGIATATPAYLLDIRSPVSTGQTAIYVYGDARVTGDLVVGDDLTVDEVTTRNINVTGLSTFAGITTVTGETLFSKQLSISGVTTLGVTTATNITAQNLNVSGIGTITTLNSTTGTITTGTITNLSGTNVNYIGISTLTNVRSTTLVNTGVTTLGTVQISSGIITATSGVVTYYGDGQYLDNVIRGVGIGTSAGIVGYGATILNFQGPGISTITVSSGIATINITGGGGGGSGSASIGIGTTPGSAGFTAGIVTAGNLWYNSNLGRMFIYYQDTDSAQWVDASPSNVGIITSLVNVSFAPGSASSPSMYFVGDSQTGFFSPSAGRFTVVSSGSSILNINPSGINVTGIATASSFVGNLTGTATYATSAGIATYATSAGIATYATTSGVSTSVIGGISSVTQLSVSGISTVGFITATNSYTSGISSVGTAITMYGSTGIVSATKYYGDGSSLSGMSTSRIINGTSNITVASGSTISATVSGQNIFNVTGIGVSMVAGERLDVSSYSENVNFLGSVSGTTALDVGTYSVFVADISGSTSVTFTLSGAVSGRLSSATLILRFSGSASRSVSLAFNPKYVGGSGPTYSTTAVTDIISFFTADAGTTTYVSVVGQGFA